MFLYLDWDCNVLRGLKSVNVISIKSILKKEQKDSTSQKNIVVLRKNFCKKFNWQDNCKTIMCNSVGMKEH